MAGKHRVVILGGGFGGLNAARALKHADVDVTLLDRRNFHLFQPLLYQIATGSLSPGEIAAPIRGVLSNQKNTRVLLGEAIDIDPANREIQLKEGGTLPYDSLVVATGSQTSFFGHEEWKKWAPGLKSVEDATAMRHKILFAFEEAERTHDPDERRAWLTFVIVGAGATGVELAGALAEIARHTLKGDFRSIRPSDAIILVVDGGSRVLSAFPEDLSAKAQKSLEQLGVTLKFGLMVTNVDADGVSAKSKDGQEHRIRAHTVLWAAGVIVSDFTRQLAKRTNAPVTRAGTIQVAPDLTIPGFPEIFAVGDSAYSVDRKGKPLPGVAQVAMQGGSYVAGVIKRRLQNDPHIKPFNYFDKGNLAVIGRGRAVADVFGIHLSGLIAWLVWVFIHLLYIVEFQSRIVVFVEWGFLYLTFNRGARLITGETAANSTPLTEPASGAAASPDPSHSLPANC